MGIFCSSSSTLRTDVISRPSSKSVTTSSRIFGGATGAGVAGSVTNSRSKAGTSASTSIIRWPHGPDSSTGSRRDSNGSLLHRYPFLFVDRIIEFEVDKRIVGIKNVSHNERYLSYDANGAAVLPPMILTETVAQVGAIMILAKPENRQRLIVFAGIKRVRFRRAVRPGDVVVIESERRAVAQPDGHAGGRGARRRQAGHGRHDDLRARSPAGRRRRRGRIASLPLG